MIFSFFSFAASEHKKEKVKEMAKIVNLDPKTIVNVFFPTDGGRWTDQIISAYVQQLSMVKSTLNFVNVSWTKGADLNIFLNNVKSANPDIVFLPDDLLFSFLGPEIQKITKAQIVFVSFHTEKEKLAGIVSNPIGVIAEAPVDILLKNARLMTGKINSIGIVGGPFAEQMINHIKSKLGSVKVESSFTGSWHEYSKTLKTFSEKYDAIWPLAAFGVKQTDGSPVTDAQLNSLIEELQKICFGYGKISGFKRTLDMDIDPVVLGRNAAALTFSYMKGEKVSTTAFTSYAMGISESHLKRLHLTVPESLKGFVSLR